MAEEELFTQIVNEDIKEYALSEGNSKCFDCKSTPANWFCVNNGIFLCAQCAGEHRGYGSVISRIKSLILDKFNEYEIAVVKNGGNLKLAELLKEYGIEDFSNINRLIVFSSKLLEYYRNCIYNQLNAKQAPEKPDKEYALEPMENFRTNTRPIVSVVTLEPPKESPKEEEKNNPENDNLNINNEKEKQKEKKEEEKKEEKGNCQFQ